MAFKSNFFMLSLLAVFAFATMTKAEGLFTQSCPANEMYTWCGSRCPVTCANLATPPAPCKGCVKGCFCNPGYFRNSLGACVLNTDC